MRAAGGDNDHSGPDGVVTVHKAGGVTELWVGDSPGKVWVLNASTGDQYFGRPAILSTSAGQPEPMNSA